MLPNEIRSGTPSVVRMLIGRSQTLPSLLLPHSRSVSNSLRRREPGFAPRMHGCGRRLPRCRRSPRLSAGTILARVAAAKSSRSAASIERLPGSPYRACCKEGRVAKFLRLPRVEPAGGICASEPEVADDPERDCREAEAPVEGRFQGPALRGSADPAGRLLVPALSAQLP